ncbi:MAG: amidohydrolase family protein, partial [Planctomycetota bacterium]
ASAPSYAQATAFRDVRLFDGTGVHERTTVVVSDGRIVTVSPDSEIPTGAMVVDGRGHTLLPGLIDAHGHFGGFAPTLEQALIFGVTTSLDMWADPEQVAERRAEQRSTGVHGRSDVFSAGTLVTAPGSRHARMLRIPATITAPEQAERFVSDRVAEGSDFIKIVYDAYGADPNWTDTTSVRGSSPSIDRPTLAAVIDAAHARDRLAVVHVLNLRSARDALEAGADGLVHVFVDEPADPDFAALAAERGLFVVPTLVIAAPSPERSELLDEPLITDYVAPGRLTPLRQWRLAIWDAREAERRVQRAAATVRTLHGQGVPILAGTDPPNPGSTYGVSIHEELVRLVGAGLTPTEALVAATSAPARAFGLTDRGRVAPGLRADLVLVRGDPTMDIRSSRAIAGVWKLGVRVDREAYAAASAPERNAWRALQAPGVSPISDFEGDSDRPTSVVGRWGGMTDASWGGSSTATHRIVEEGAEGSRKSLLITGTTVANGDSTLAGPIYRLWGGLDLSAKSALVFRAKGQGGDFRVVAIGADPSVGIAVHTFSVGAGWTEVVVPLSGLAPVYPRPLLGFVFTGPRAGGDFTLQIDDVLLR